MIKNHTLDIWKERRQSTNSGLRRSILEFFPGQQADHFLLTSCLSGNSGYEIFQSSEKTIISNYFGVRFSNSRSRYSQIGFIVLKKQSLYDSHLTSSCPVCVARCLLISRMKACLLALLALPSVFAVRCYDYISTNDNRNTMKSWVDCPYEAQFCFKSYIEQHDMNNEKTWLASRSCGTPNLCTVGVFSTYQSSSVLDLVHLSLQTHTPVSDVCTYLTLWGNPSNE
ncbi:hypothetical protein Y032_0057g2728 [Ancylostoma ceylanicum]|uniref:Uncharacterized protein n=1 Tax=Ancylostoma ceylanicum TaxID=53326 RepID=A0A016U556_9BILA|nr:hypothetical protein Y032_0057g2728 [Ancylostoma ceylanicum]